jgi:hypothetical protein
VLARANAAMVEPEADVTGALASLLSGAMQALPADAAGVLVDSDGTLEVLAATSHRATDLEAYQRQVEEGPCLDVIRSGHPASACGAEALDEQWPQTGPAIRRAGYISVQAMPLRWQGNTFGGLNLFRTDPVDFDAEQAECRALADAVTLILVTGHLDARHVAEGLRTALTDRAVVEQAKGALAHTQSLEMSGAFAALCALADAEGVTLGVAARRVMHQARTGNLPGQ